MTAAVGGCLVVVGWLLFGVWFVVDGLLFVAGLWVGLCDPTTQHNQATNH